MKKFSTIRQHDTRDCGATCLYMICSYFGLEPSIQQLRKLTNTSQDGVTIWGMVEAAKKLGITAEGYFGEIADLKNFMLTAQSPVVLHLKNNHFVVGYKMSKKFIYIKDPAKGRYKTSWNDLLEVWSGYMIGFAKTNDKSEFNVIKKKQDKYTLMFELLKKHFSPLCKVIFLSIVVFLITICSNYIFQVFIDHEELLEHNHDASNFFINFLISIYKHNVNVLLAYMISFFVFMAILVGIRGKCIAIMSREIDVSLVKRYVRKISKASMHDISSRMTGEYLARISDLVSLRRMITDLLIAVTLDVIMVVASVIILFRTNKMLFFVSFVGIFLYVLIALALKNFIHEANHKIMSNNAEMQSFFKEFLQGIEVIKANNENEIVEKRFFDKYDKYANSVFHGNMLGVVSNSLSTLIEQVSNVLVVVMGFVFVEAHWITLGELFTFYLFLACMTEPIKDILSFQSTFQSGLVALERLEDIRFMEEERIGGTAVTGQQISIDVNDVYFHYPGKPSLLQGISFRVSGEEKVVLQGDNGSGKSTMVKLIMGMENVEKGSITINGVDVRKVDLQDLRNKVSYVAQTNFLFADTLRNNVTFGDAGYSQEDVERACELAGLHEMIEEMPMKYDTYIDENGGNVSMGQRQAIAIARALIRKPQFLILDEATSNMDEKREKIVMENIAKLPIPCIIISHGTHVSDFLGQKVKLVKINQRNEG